MTMAPAVMENSHCYNPLPLPRRPLFGPLLGMGIVGGGAVSGLAGRFLSHHSYLFLITKNVIKSNGYKITNKINKMYIIDFIGYFILL